MEVSFKINNFPFFWGSGHIPACHTIIQTRCNLAQPLSFIFYVQTNESSSTGNNSSFLELNFDISSQSTWQDNIIHLSAKSINLSEEAWAYNIKYLRQEVWIISYSLLLIAWWWEWETARHLDTTSGREKWDPLLNVKGSPISQNCCSTSGTDHKQFSRPCTMSLISFPVKIHLMM